MNLRYIKLQKKARRSPIKNYQRCAGDYLRARYILVGLIQCGHCYHTKFLATGALLPLIGVNGKKCERFERRGHERKFFPCATTFGSHAHVAASLMLRPMPLMYDGMCTSEDIYGGKL